MLRDDGTLWLNLGDSYWGGKGQSSQAWSTAHTERDTLQKPHHQISGMKETRPSDGKHDIFKPKDLCMIPARVALALQADGWWLRSAIVWAKGLSFCDSYAGHPMPESVTDRPASAYEMVYLLTKSERYYYDHVAVSEKTVKGAAGSTFNTGKTAIHQEGRASDAVREDRETRNLRNVWVINPEPFKGWTYDFASADYVDARGIPHKWSPNCPMHERDGRRRQSSSVVVACGALRASDQKINSERIDVRRVQEPSGVVAPIDDCKMTQVVGNPLSSPSGDNHASSILAQTETDGPEKSVHTTGIQGGCDPSMKDSPPPACGPSASLHNIDGCKSDHADQTSSDDSVSSESSCHTECMELPLCGNVPHANKSGSNKAPCTDRPKSAVGTVSRNFDKYSYTQDKCLCTISQVSHFATFPKKLVDPCILAGTSESGQCPECGKPWVRVTETKRTFESGSGRSGNMLVGKNGPDMQGGGETGDIRRGPTVQVKTLGWRPDCLCGNICPADPVPQIVIDPFCGKGTTAKRAKELGRRCLTCDLNEEYCELARRELSQEELF